MRARLADPVLALLKQGVSPEKLALSLAAGCVVGVIPLLGTTTILCTVIALVFRLNLPAIQLANWAVYPVQLLLLLPFLQAGNALMGAEPLPYAPNELVALFQSGFRDAFHLLWEATLRGLLVWGTCGMVSAVILYAFFRLVLGRMSQTIRLLRQGS